VRKVFLEIWNIGLQRAFFSPLDCENGGRKKCSNNEKKTKVKEILATTVEMEIDNEDTVDNSLSLESFGLANFERTSDSEFETDIEYLSEKKKVI